jgi:hypothetical protein
MIFARIYNNDKKIINSKDFGALLTKDNIKKI